MSAEQWFQLAKDGGAYIAPFLLGALLWMNTDRNRLIAENKLKDDRLVALSERSLTVFAEVKTFMFKNELKAGS